MMKMIKITKMCKVTKIIKILKTIKMNHITKTIKMLRMTKILYIKILSNNEIIKKTKIKNKTKQILTRLYFQASWRLVRFLISSLMVKLNCTNY